MKSLDSSGVAGESFDGHTQLRRVAHVGGRPAGGDPFGLECLTERGEPGPVPRDQADVVPPLPNLRATAMPRPGSAPTTKIPLLVMAER